MTPERREYNKNYRRNRYASDPDFAERARAGKRRTIARKREMVDELKNVPCTDCGGRFPSVCMDFDHIEFPKLFTIGSTIASHSKDDILAEIAKCDVVCANCHRIRTRDRLV